MATKRATAKRKQETTTFEVELEEDGVAEDGKTKAFKMFLKAASAVAGFLKKSSPVQAVTSTTVLRAPGYRVVPRSEMPRKGKVVRRFTGKLKFSKRFSDSTKKRDRREIGGDDSVRSRSA